MKKELTVDTISKPSFVLQFQYTSHTQYTILYCKKLYLAERVSMELEIPFLFFLLFIRACMCFHFINKFTYFEAYLNII